MDFSPAIEFIKREIERPGSALSAEGEKNRGGREEAGGDDNVERLLTKIEVVVMTGIARDDALR